MDATAPHTPLTKEALETENQRMRARIKELESKLAEKGEADSTSGRRSRGSRTQAVSPETEDRLRSIPGHARDELDRLARGLSYAAAEHLRATSDVINSFADEFFARSAERGAESRTRRSSRRATSGTVRETDQDTETHVQRAADNVSNMTDDVLAGVSRGIHESIETPRRVIERFFDAYETDPASAQDPSGRRAQASARQEKVAH
jgi:cell division septum initiation protein DivIVA